jgi:hypothetical protein
MGIKSTFEKDDEKITPKEIQGGRDIFYIPMVICETRILGQISDCTNRRSAEWS